MSVAADEAVVVGPGSVVHWPAGAPRTAPPQRLARSSSFGRVLAAAVARDLDDGRYAANSCRSRVLAVFSSPLDLGRPRAWQAVRLLRRLQQRQ